MFWSRRTSGEPYWYRTIAFMVFSRSVTNVTEPRLAAAAKCRHREPAGPRVNRPGAGSPTYVAETVPVAARHLGVSPADSVAMADELKPLAISHTAMTISCTASGAMSCLLYTSPSPRD